MKNKIKEVSTCMRDMENKASIWTMVKIISKILNDNEITYEQFIDIVVLIDHYTHNEAEMISDLDEEKIDIDEEDGEWFVIPAI